MPRWLAYGEGFDKLDYPWFFDKDKHDHRRWHFGDSLLSTVSSHKSFCDALHNGCSDYYYLTFDHMCGSSISKGQSMEYRVPTRDGNSWLPGTPVASE